MKDEEENTMHNTVVMFSSTDTFTLKQVGPLGVCLENSSVT